MKRTELILSMIALALLLMWIGSSWLVLLKIAVGILLVCTILHWKVAPYKNQLSVRYTKMFDGVDSILKMFLTALSSIPKIQIGPRIQLDMSYITLIGVLTIILIVL